jgi:hypothetical protein
VRITTDGLPNDDAGPLDDEGRELCEFCNRLYPRGRGLLVGVSGSMEQCLHCACNGSYADLVAKTLSDENVSALIKNLALYFARAAAEHDRGRCRWAPACFLCDALAADALPRDRRSVRAWLSRYGALADRPPRVDLGALRRWPGLGPGEQVALAAALAGELSAKPGAGAFAATEAGGVPCLRHGPTGITLMIVPRSKPRERPFLLSRTVVTVEQGARLGVLRAPASAGDESAQTLPLTGFDLRALFEAWSSSPFRLPNASEWLVASRRRLRGVAYAGAAGASVPASPEACCWHAGNARSPQPVEAHAAYANDLGLVDLVGNVDELVGVGDGYIETIGGSYRNTASELEPMLTLAEGDAAPSAAGERRVRLPIGSLDERDALGRLPPLPLPPHVGFRVAVDI